jgi:hypothetical protein
MSRLARASGREEEIRSGANGEEVAMDDERFAELKRKRDSEGLTDDEADELGRLMAEREGKPYSNADAVSSSDATPMAWEEETKREEEEADEVGEGRRLDRTQPSDAERSPVAPGGSGYIPPKGADEPEEE